MITKLNTIIAEYDLLQHPFYQQWSAGTLSKSTLQSYASQYYQQVASFPRFISRVHTHCPEITVRKVLLENLMDEELHGKDHPHLWQDFAAGLGVAPATLATVTPFPETAHMVNTYYELAACDWRAGLCALYAYEYQVPAVSASKIAGLSTHYGIDDEQTLAFFSTHLAYDVEHAQKVATLIEAYVPQATAESATRCAAKVLWQFLDGMCREAGMLC